MFNRMLARRSAPMMAVTQRRMFSSTLRKLEPFPYEAFHTAAVQQKAPVFSAKAVVDGAITDKFSLENYKGRYVVVLFYPLDFTFVCPTEIINYSERVEEFRKLNCEVVAVSVDSAFSHLAWTKQPRKTGGLGPMNIPLVSDITKEISRDYGVLIEDQGVALRGLFIIDDKQIVRQITINDLPVGRNVDETLRLVAAFRQADETGEVVPCGWVPGKATMKPAEAAKYFEKHH